ATAPSTSGVGAWSPPIASTATVRMYGSGLGLFGLLQHFAIAVVAARLAHAVRQLRLLAARALRHRRLGHRAHPLRPTVIAHRLRLPSLRNSHGPCLSISRA